MLTAIREHGTHGQVTHITDGVVKEPVHQKPYTRSPTAQWREWDEAGLLTDDLLRYIAPPNWDGFAIDASKASLFAKLVAYAPPNLFSILMAQIQTFHSEELLLEYFGKCSSAMPPAGKFTTAEKLEVNALLEQHGFAGRI